MTKFLQISLQTYLSAIALTSSLVYKESNNVYPILGVFSTKTLVFGA